MRKSVAKMASTDYERDMYFVNCASLLIGQSIKNTVNRSVLTTCFVSTGNDWRIISWGLAGDSVTVHASCADGGPRALASWLHPSYTAMRWSRSAVAIQNEWSLIRMPPWALRCCERREKGIECHVRRCTESRRNNPGTVLCSVLLNSKYMNLWT